MAIGSGRSDTATGSKMETEEKGWRQSKGTRAKCSASESEKKQG
jgi:hypothetical protein